MSHPAARSNSAARSNAADSAVELAGLGQWRGTSDQTHTGHDVSDLESEPLVQGSPMRSLEDGTQHQPGTPPGNAHLQPLEDSPQQAGPTDNMAEHALPQNGLQQTETADRHAAGKVLHLQLHLMK